MKVLYFHQYFSTPGGSSGMRSYEFAKALVGHGHIVTMVCGSYACSDTGLEPVPFVKGRREGNVDGIHVIEFEIPYSNRLNFFDRTLSFLSFAIRAVAEAMTADYDLAFATSTPLTIALPGLIAKWIRRKTFVFEVRDLWPELPRAMGVIKNPLILFAMGTLERVAYRSADALVGLAPGIIDGIRSRGAKSKPIIMIPNGCDSKLFSPSEDRENRLPGVIDDDFIGVFCGTHGAANGLNAVLDAAIELKKAGRPDIKLSLIGDGKEKPALQKRCAIEGIDNVIFQDSLSKAQLATKLRAAHVGLMILANVRAFYEGTSPNKFFDYIATGLPVLINYPGWIADLVIESGCGMAVPPEDPMAFAQALTRMCDDRLLLRKMGLKSLELSKRFGRSALAERFVTFLEEVQSATRGTAR